MRPLFSGDYTHRSTGSTRPEHYLALCKDRRSFLFYWTLFAVCIHTTCNQDMPENILGFWTILLEKTINNTWFRHFRVTKEIIDVLVPSERRNVWHTHEGLGEGRVLVHT